jgi:hypothetical protein
VFKIGDRVEHTSLGLYAKGARIRGTVVNIVEAPDHFEQGVGYVVEWDDEAINKRDPDAMFSSIVIRALSAVDQLAELDG